MNVLIRKNASGMWAVQCFVPAPEKGRTLMVEHEIPLTYTQNEDCRLLLHWLGTRMREAQVELLQATVSHAAGLKLVDD